MNGHDSDRALRILANSIVRELHRNGYGLRHIVRLANELIDLACQSIRSNGSPANDS